MRELITIYNCRPKGHQCQLGNLKTLQSKGNSDDGAAQNHPIYYGANCQRNAAYDDPQNIGKKRHSTATVLDFLPKRKKCKRGKLKTLPPDGNPYNCDTPQDPPEPP